jgi:foldase protein PrsA
MTGRKKNDNRSFKIRVLSIFLVSIMILMAGCSGKYPEPDSLVLTVNGNKVYMNEMMYHVMLEKLQGDLYASFLGGETKDYWEMEADNGKTMREAAKDQAMENAVKYELFYQMAKDDNYSLTEDEKNASITKVENIMQNVPAEQIAEYGLTKEQLVLIQDKITAATNYYNKYVDTMIDKAAITASIKAEDYEQYNIEYIYGNLDQKDMVLKLVDTANVEADFSELVKDTGLNSGKLTFLKGDNTFGEEENLESVITSMEAGSVSGLVETVKGYYLIKLKDNTSTSEYDKAVKSAIDTALSQVFDDNFDKLKQDHEIKINNKVWNKVVIGD